jgi:hypothetical protein
LGHSECQINWSYIKKGLPAAQVELLLGSPDGITSSGTAATEIWEYKPDARIDFSEGIFIGFEKPVSFVYYGPVSN